MPHCDQESLINMITIPFLPNYRILLSDRHDGSFREQEAIMKQLENAGVQKTIGVMQLTHGSHRIHWHDKITEEKADAVLTDNMNICLSMVVGDCFPIILIDQKKQVIVMIHGGWRSLLQNIVELTMKELKGHYGTQAKDVYAWIGPGIRQESNTTPYPPVQSMFPEWQSYITQHGETYHVDLVEHIKYSLTKCAVRAENIFDYGKDTYQEKETFFSHRRAKVEHDEDGRFIVAVYKNTP